MLTFLLTDGEFTGLIKSLRELSDEVRIIGFVSSMKAAHTAMLDKAYCPPDSHSPEYLEYVEKVIADEQVDFVFPVITTALDLMAELAEKIYADTGARVIISSPESIHIANNKANLYDALSAHGLQDIIAPYRRVSTVGELKKVCKDFIESGIDCISKPVQGENAEGFMHIVDDETYARALLAGDLKGMATLSSLDILPDDEKLSEERLVMSYLPGREYDADILSYNGKVIAATIRVNHEMLGGLSACSETVNSPEILSYCEAIVRELNLDYISCISFREDEDGSIKLLEINPRTMGSIHLSTLAGNNLIAKLLELFDEKKRAGISADDISITRCGFTASLYNDIESVNNRPVEWHKLTPSDIQTYRDYYYKISTRMTDLSFGCRFAWDELYDINWAIIDDCLVQVSFGEKSGFPFMLMPLGDLNSTRLEHIICAVKSEFDQRGLKLSITCIDEKYLSVFEKIRRQHTEPYYKEDYSDYLYDGEKLRSLKGRNLSKKRNHLKQFVTDYPDYTYESLTADHAKECLDMVRLWGEEKGIDINNTDDSDYLMIKRVLDNWDLLDYRGGLIRVNGRMIAFSIGSQEKTTAYVHFEKANIRYEGAYTAINKLVQEHEFPDAKYVNREEDLGIPGLRQAKKSYQPADMIRKYRIDFYKE